MNELGVSRTSLAERAATTKSHVSQLLNGSRNMTLRTLADLAYSLGHRMRLEAEPLAAVAQTQYPYQLLGAEPRVFLAAPQVPTTTYLFAPDTTSTIGYSNLQFAQAPNYNSLPKAEQQATGASERYGTDQSGERSTQPSTPLRAADQRLAA
jgi:transcriptional regulator with XRE-family HTH domain